MKKLNEDAPTNSAGSGAVAGIGVGPDGEPGVSKEVQKKIRKKNKVLKRKSFKRFIEEQVQLYEVGDSSYSYTMSEYGDVVMYQFNSKRDTIQVLFKRDDPSSETYDFEVSFLGLSDGEFHKTGLGDEFRVMSTISKIILDFIRNVGVDSIHLTASSKSKDGTDTRRSAMYERVLKRIMRKLPEYKLDVRRAGQNTFFTIRIL